MASRSDYAKFLSEVPHAYLTQSPAWTGVKRNWEAQHFTATSDGEVVCAAQMLSIRDAKTGQYFCYIPRGPVTAISSAELLKPTPDTLPGSLESGSQSASTRGIINVIEQAWQAARDLDAKVLRLDPEWINTPFNQALAQNIADKFGGEYRRYPEPTYGQLPFDMVGDTQNGDLEQWFSQIGSRLRGKIRKSLRENVQAYSVRDLSLVQRFYELTEETASRQHISHRPKEYFQDLLNSFEDAYFSVGTFEDEILAMALNIPYKDTVYYIYAANSLIYPKLNIPTLMVYETFRSAIERGYNYVNLGACHHLNDDDHLYKYKRLFTGENGARSYVGEIDLYPNGK